MSRSLPIGMHIVQTVVTLAANTDTVALAASPNHKYIAIQNIGSGDAYLGFSQAAVAGQGWLLQANGGGITFETSAIPRNVLHAISTPGTTLIVMEGQ